MQNLVDSYPVFDMMLKLTTALILSGLLGLERERRGRAAGLRTHILVCLGTTMAMITSDLLANEWVVMDTNVWLDRGLFHPDTTGGYQRGDTGLTVVWRLSRGRTPEV